jgi:hypothetical protein
MAEEKEKPFGAVDIVLLVFVAGLSDIADLITDLLFPVPVLGQVVYVANAFFVSPLVWATIQLWFIMKVGFGAPGLVNLAGGIGNVIGIPGSQTVTVIIATLLANNPKAAAIASAASVAGAAKTAAAGGQAAAAGEKAVGAAGGEAGAAKAALAEAPAPAKAGPAPAEKLFASPSGPMEKLQAELAETRPLPEREPVTLDEENNAVDLRQAA